MTQYGEVIIIFFPGNLHGVNSVGMAPKQRSIYLGNMNKSRAEEVIAMTMRLPFVFSLTSNASMMVTVSGAYKSP